MRRSLSSSEKTLLALCLAAVVLVGGFFVRRDHQRRLAAAQERINNLESRSTAAIAAAGDAPFWKQRQAWLDEHMPVMGDSGQAHSRLLEELQDAARNRGLRIVSPVLLKPESGPHHRELSVSLQITGPDSALFRWLAELQSPEKFHVVKYLLLTPMTTRQPRMTGSVTIAKLYKP